jgi:hypothetical protein
MTLAQKGRHITKIRNMESLQILHVGSNILYFLLSCMLTLNIYI